MEVEHLTDVHPVDVVRAEDGHDVRMMIVDEIEVLIDRVCGPLKPLRALAHLRRNHGDELIGKNRRKCPGTIDVFDQGLRLVLHHQIDRVDSGVD